MTHLITVGILTAVFAQAPAPVPVELQPIFVVDAAKIYNSTPHTIVITYKFATDDPRTASIAPNDHAYLYDHPGQIEKRPLTVTVISGTTSKAYTAETSGVSVSPPHSSPPPAQMLRIDEARPYHLAISAGGQIALQKGFPTAMLSEAGATIRHALQKNNVDIGYLGTATNTSSTDPIIVQIEFMHASPVLKYEFSKLLGANYPIDFQLSWMPVDPNQSDNRFTPQIRVPTCPNDVAAEYVTAVLKTVITPESAYLPATAEVCTNCCQYSVLTEPQLKRQYISEGKPNIDEIWRVVFAEARQRLTMGIEHSEPLDSKRYHICSNWTYIQNTRAQYRWKVKVVTGEALIDNDRTGVLLHTNLVAEKSSLGSSEWRPMADFVVSRMGQQSVAIPEAIVQTSGFRGNPPRPPAPPFSEAQKFATSVEFDLESLLLAE